jgi:hypothetical protein
MSSKFLGHSRFYGLKHKVRNSSSSPGGLYSISITLTYSYMSKLRAKECVQ